MALKLITPPAVEPVSLTEVKSHLRLDHDDDDALLAIYITAARQMIDGRTGWLGRSLINQTWELQLDTFPSGEIQIPLAPLQSITSVKYDDGEGVEQTIDTADYALDTSSEPGWIVTAGGYSWASTLDAINAVRVRFVAGYGATGADVPAPIRAAILLMVGDLHRQRSSFRDGSVTAVPMSTTVESLLQGYRIWSL